MDNVPRFNHREDAVKKFVLIAAFLLLVPTIGMAADYVIGEGDSLSVHVWGENDLRSTVLVRPDGKVSMPGIDDLRAAGLTFPQLKKVMEKEMSALIKDPIINISLLRSVNSRVFVVGGGVEPQVYDMPQRTTLLHVLASVGTLDMADLDKAYLYRNGKVVMSDFTGLFSKGEFSKDIQLEPGDTIFLPVKYQKNVFVLGAVNQPKAIFFQEGLTVLDALLQAGDFNKYADEDEITIVRNKEDKKEVITVRTKDLIKKGDLTQNVMLQAGDYLIAKESFFLNEALMSEPSSGAYSNDVSVDLVRYLHLVMARKGLLVTLALLVMSAAIIASYVLPKKYEAESIVFIEQNVISDLVKGIAITPSMDMKIKAIKVTMLSRSMLLNVIKSLDMDLRLKSDQALDGMIEGLQNRIQISLDEKKGVFRIAFADKDPVLARDVVNTLTRIYIEENTSTKRKESFEATKFLAEQIEMFKERINKANQEIDRFRAEAGPTLTSNEVVLRAENENMESQLEGIKTRIHALETSRSLLLRNTPLRQQLDQQRLELKTIRTRYTDNHPAVKKLKSLIAETERQIKSGGNSDLSSIYGTAEYQGIKIELGALEKTQMNLEAKIEENKEIIKQIPHMRTRLSELERNKQNEVIIYEKLVSRYGQSEVSKEMELQDKSMSFRVLDPAVIPTMHSSPNRPLIILMGIFGGLGFAIGVIILMDLINPSIKTLDDLRAFGIPVLAVVPKVRDEEVIASERRKDRIILSVGIGGIVFSLMFFVIEFMHLGIVDKVIAKVARVLIG